MEIALVIDLKPKVKIPWLVTGGTRIHSEKTGLQDNGDGQNGWDYCSRNPRFA
jgi:hypothetical protein